MPVEGLSLLFDHSAAQLAQGFQSDQLRSFGNELGGKAATTIITQSKTPSQRAQNLACSVDG